MYLIAATIDLHLNVLSIVSYINFFSVFTKEVNITYNTQDIQVQEPVKLNFYFSEFMILQKMDNINITKSPGPDSIHPRILYEIRHEILQPLYVLFNTSYQLGKYPRNGKLQT